MDLETRDRFRGGLMKVTRENITSLIFTKNNKKLK